MFSSHISRSLFMQKLALRTNQTTQGDGMSLPCGSVQERLLNRTQAPISPESQGGKGNTSYSRLLGYGQRPYLHLSLLGSVFFVLRGKSGHSLGMMDFQALRQPEGQLLPGAAPAPSARPIKVAQRASILFVKVPSPREKQEIIHSLSQPMYTKAHY